MNSNYLVSIFSDGKNLYSYFSENLDELVTIKALYKDCEIQIFDLVNFAHFTPERVKYEIFMSCIRWIKSLEKPKIEEPIEQKPNETTKKEKRKKYWERPVLCVETGQVFSSIRECSDKLGIPYMTITNCIKNGNDTRGVHFVNAPKP